MMFLVPPNLVAKENKKDGLGRARSERKFLGSDYFDSIGIKIWDGTKYKNKI